MTSKLKPGLYIRERGGKFAPGPLAVSAVTFVDASGAQMEIRLSQGDELGVEIYAYHLDTAGHRVQVEPMVSNKVRVKYTDPNPDTKER